LAAIEAAARRVAADLAAFGGRPGLLELARGIAAVAAPHASLNSGAGGPEARERAGRVVGALSAAAAEAPPSPAPPGGESDESDLDDAAAAAAAAAAASAATATPPERACLDGLAPGGVPTCPDGPMGPPTAPALRSGPPGVRYAALTAAVEAAVRGVMMVGGGAPPVPPFDDAAVGVPGVFELARLAAGALPASAAAAAAGAAAGGGPRPGLVSLLPLQAGGTPALDGCAPFELTAPGDPVRVAILAADLDAPARTVSLRLEATNRTPIGLGAGGVGVVLQWAGAAVGPGRGRGALPLPPLAPGDSHTWRTDASLTSPGPASVGVVVDLSALAGRALGGSGDAPASLRGPVRFSFGPAAWLAVPAANASSTSTPPITTAGPFFRAWAGAPAAGAARGVCVRPGQAGPPALLGALTQGAALSPAWVAPLPGQAGFVGALAGVSPLSGWPVLVVVSSRLAVGEGGGGAARLASLAGAPHPFPPPAGLPPHALATFEIRTRCPAMAAGIAANPAGFVSAAAGGELATEGGAGLAVGGGAPIPPPAGRPSAVGAALAALCGRGVVPDMADTAAAAVGGLDAVDAAAHAAAASEWRRLVGERAREE
jgi:hypothetical protein